MDYNNTVKTAIAACILFTALQAHAVPSKYYVRLDVPYLFKTTLSGDYKEAGGSRTTIKKTIAGQLGAGIQLNNYLRTDLTVASTGAIKYTEVNPPVTQHTKIHVTYAMLNAYYDIAKIYSFTPYVTAGGGGSRHIKSGVLHSNNPTNSVQGEKTTHFAWKVGTGLAYNLTDKFMVDMGYHYFHFGYVKHKNITTSGESTGVAPFKGRLNSHQLWFGARYLF